MLRHELFKKLAKVNKNDRILLLTHDDADGAGAEIVLRCMFPKKNIEVVHLNNGVMSGRVKEALTDAAIAESFGKVIVCDIFPAMRRMLNISIACLILTAGSFYWTII